MVETDAAIWNFERVVLCNGLHSELCISGWFCPKPPEVVTELAILVDGDRFPCLAGLPRPDVAKHFKTLDYLPSGFLVRLPAGTVNCLIQAITASGKEKTINYRISPHDVQTERSAAGSYIDWLAHIEDQSGRAYPIEKSSISQVQISVILPTYNTPLYYLDRCIRSIVTQAYPFWELCIADDGSSDPRVLRELKSWATRDRRIHVRFCEKQGGISAASNSAVDQATGEFIVLLDHYDEFHPLAFTEIAKRLASVPDTDLIYSDEDKIDDLGRRMHPVFKPNFDADLLASYDYIGHLVCIRKERVIEVGGFRPERDGSQDWDLLLRVTERCGPDRIQHLPRPLYHWRMHSGSTALSLDAKPYVFGAWTKVVGDHIIRQNIRADVEPGLFLGSMRLRRRFGQEVRVAVVYRASDGSNQERAIRRIPLPAQTSFYEVFLSTIRAARPASGDQPQLWTMEDLNADVLIFLNCRLESVNHGFMEELVPQALRDDCGVISGVVADRHGLVVSCGLAFGQSDDLVNPFRGLPLSSAGYMGLTKVVRSVPGIDAYYFAVRSDFARSAFCLSNISEDGLDTLCTRLVSISHGEGRNVLVTPYAVATLQYNNERATGALADPASSRLRLNRNLEDFGEVDAVLKRGNL
jgi:hypothetical protein